MDDSEGVQTSLKGSSGDVMETKRALEWQVEPEKAEMNCCNFMVLDKELLLMDEQRKLLETESACELLK